MAKQATVIDLDERVEALRKERGDAVPVGEIANIVGALVEGTTQGDDLGKISSELQELLVFIGAAKSELIDMQPKSLSHRDIPDAGEQLDAIVDSTEEAASSILDAAEGISAIAETIEGEASEKLEVISTNLFQASSFQDLTGQRVTKVTRTLNQLEERLSALAEAIGDDFVAPPEEEIEVDFDGVAVNSDDLLHGPQLEGEGNSQAEIDAILASFD
ncbi:protein phosphatase CheZ [Kordiimonas aquimaris]|uniref:protein phosphatase CheZ n=1 Tax=Kordiimonas aquimaris TaxID=707591 RepID=UPI0021D2F4FF|nr:protein phosphatase CheZ [Kordiimonas aquimaris]